MNGRTEAQRLDWRRCPDSNDREATMLSFLQRQRTRDGGGEEERIEGKRRKEASERIPGNAALVQSRGAGAGQAILQ